MADTESSEAFDDELLSAYVDGELDEGQRALVEQRLQDDSRAKQLVDELQGLSTTLQSLPREQLGDDLRKAVLRQTEEKMASLSSPGDWGSVSRRWAWAAMAIAATLALVVFQPEVEEQEQQLAKAVPEAGRASRSEPQLRAPAGAMPEEIAADEVEHAAEADLESLKSAGEGAEEVFFVHITPADANTGQQQFDELLVKNQIDLDRVPLAAVAAEASARAQGAGARRGAAASPPRESSAQPEVVLVEASPVQIENLLMSCNADTRNWNSLSFETQSDSRLPVPRWRSLERKGGTGVQLGKLSDAAETEEVVAAAKASNQNEEDSSFSKNKEDREARQRAMVPRGRATRLGSDWQQLPVQLKAIAEGKHPVGERGKALPPDEAAQIRVFFVLHPGEMPRDLGRALSGKKAATDK